jgi:hypothetical protein
MGPNSRTACWCDEVEVVGLFAVKRPEAVVKNVTYDE